MTSERAEVVREFAEWVATQKAFNGADRAGQALYDYGLNVVLLAWAEEWLAEEDTDDVE